MLLYRTRTFVHLADAHQKNDRTVVYMDSGFVDICPAAL